MTILQKIIEARNPDLLSYQSTNFNFEPITKVKPSLFETLKNTSHIQIIAEIKRASPSKGDIDVNVDPVKQAIAYEAAGASCISVLTEPHFFKGSYADLHAVAHAVSIPVLCKDFIVDPIQIDIAKQAGASVILLIVAALTKETLQALHQYATSKQLEVLVEVHTLEEFEIAQQIGAKIIGVNNRNLKTFNVDLTTTTAITSSISATDFVFISESGVQHKEDAIYLAQQNVSGLLIGETLMRTDNIEQTLQSFQVPLKAGV